MMDSRKGTALLLALWVIALLGALTAMAIGHASNGVATSRNRVALLRATWAGRGCGALLDARFADPTGRARLLERGRLDSTSLGGGTWCQAEWEDPTTRVNLNQAAPEALRRLGLDSLSIAAVLAARPLPAVEALWWRAGLDSAALEPLLPSLTVEGDGRVNVGRAPATVLLTLPGADEAVAADLVRARVGAAWTSLDDMLSVLSAESRGKLMARYDALSQRVAFAPTSLVVRLTGTAGSPPRSAVVTRVIALQPDRLAVMRQVTP